MEESSENLRRVSPIDSMEELLSRRLPPGARCIGWVPGEEIREQCTPRFCEEYERLLQRFLAQYRTDHAACVRRCIEVTARKYRARRKQRR